MGTMISQNLPSAIEIFQVGPRRLYAKTTGGAFAIFEDELTPEELVAIAQDIAARRAGEELCLATAPLTDSEFPQSLGSISPV
jgi:hypothetical protein